MLLSVFEEGDSSRPVTTFTANHYQNMTIQKYEDIVMIDNRTLKYHGNRNSNTYY